MIPTVIQVALGGAIGAAARYGVGVALFRPGSFPLGADRGDFNHERTAGMSRVQTLTVGPDEGDQRLDRWMKRRFPHLTQGNVEKMCRKGEIKTTTSSR